jgi:hypothetical protein
MQYAGAVIACSAVTLLASAAWKAHTEKRELTLKEAHGVFWGCAVPIIGPLVFNYLYDSNGWAKYESPKPRPVLAVKG